MKSKLRRHISFPLTFLVLFSVLAPAATALDWNKSEIEQCADFGKSLPPYVFSCTNTGTALVTITDIRSNCGCLTPVLDKKKLAPGESAHLTVSFDRTGRIGETRRFITIVTDEPTHNTYQLVLRANLLEALTFTSRFVVWKIGEPEKTKSIDIKINLPRPSEITQATSNNDNITVKLVALEAGRHYRLDITPRDTATPCLATIILHPAEPLPANTPLAVFAQVR